jgi:hypothetical protein
MEVERIYADDDYRFINIDYDNTSFIDISGYDYMAEINPYRFPDMAFTTDNGTIKIFSNDEIVGSLEIKLDDDTLYTTNILTMLEPYFEDIKTEVIPELILTDENENISIKIIFKHANYNKSEDNLDYNANLLIKLK